MISLSFDAGIATLVMQRPPVNALDGALIARLGEALTEVEAEAPAILVLRSDQKCFSAGADLGQILGYFEHPDGAGEMVAFVRSLHSLFNRLEALPVVTLACIAGPALGGGLEMALACDMRITTPGARLGLPEARVGMIPGAGGTQRLARLCGQGTASRLILSADIIDGSEAARLGLAQWCVEAEGFDAAVATIAARVAGLSGQALAAAKHCILAGLDPAQDGYAAEIAVPAWLMKTEEARSRVARFFQSRQTKS